jgi:hypothetical protein
LTYQLPRQAGAEAGTETRSRHRSSWQLERHLSRIVDGKVLLCLAIITVLFAGRFEHSSGRTYPVNPALYRKPFTVRVEQVEQSKSLPATQVSVNFRLGRITLFQAQAGELLIRGRLSKTAVDSGQLVVRSSQPIFLISSIRGDSMLSDAPPADAFLLTIAARGHGKVRKPCVLVDVGGKLTPLASSAVSECGTG